jgi:hypothetical protein
MTGALVLSLGLGALAATGWLVACTLRLDGVLEHVLGAFVVGTAWLISVCLGLSAVERLSRWPLLALLLLGAVVALLLHRRDGRPHPPLDGAVASARDAIADPVVAMLLAVVLLEVVYVLVFTLVIPQTDWDALLYHLPRAAAWAQQEGIGWIDGVDDPRLNGFAPHAEIGMTATMVLGGSDRYVGLVQLVSLLATAVAIALLALRLGLSHRAAAFGALVWATLPVVAVQAPTALNDLALTAPLLAATALAFGRTRAALGLAAVATAVGFGVKLTALLVAPLAALVVLAGLPRRRAAVALASCLAGAVVGSYWYLVARSKTGSIDGGVAEWQNQVPERDLGSTLDRAASFAASFLDGSGVARADRWLFPLVGVALVCVAVGLARTGRRASHLVVAACVVAAAPLAVYLGRVALGREHRVDDLPLSLVDPMGSWYGLAFVVAWPAALVAVLRAGPDEVPKRAAALVALAAPALFVVVLAVAVVDDGLRGRFFMVPVALAAAVLGTVLRWRAVAWATTVLASMTALLAFVHFDDRPIGIRLLAPRVEPALWSAPRWQAQAAHGLPHHASVIRALEERLPPDATVAAAIGGDEYLYPVFDGRLRRRVELVAVGAAVPAEATWLVVGPGGEARICGSDWKVVARPADGWRILRRARAGDCPEREVA